MLLDLSSRGLLDCRVMLIVSFCSQGIKQFKVSAKSCWFKLNKLCPLERKKTSLEISMALRPSAWICCCVSDMATYVGRSHTG